MNEQEVRALVERMVAELAGKAPTPQVKAADYHQAEPECLDQECLDDIAEINLREQYLVSQPRNGQAYLELKRKTPARIGIGRAGARYKTITMLRVRADHAAAQDSVFSHVDEKLPEKMDWVTACTLCGNKDDYLTRPDKGRRFDEKNQQIVKQVFGNQPRVALVVGDGLSSAAIEANAPDCVAAICAGLEGVGIKPGKVLFVRYCRVGASDHIGELTGAEVVCMLVGERPGLVTAESMSAYVTYKPYIGIPESRRTVISNIHRQGTAAVEAGAHIAELIETMLKKKASGIDLKAQEAE